MSSFCGGTGSVPAMTPSEIAEKFPNGFLPESLPPMEGGLAAQGWLNQYISSLKSQGRLPSPPSAQSLQSTPLAAPETSDPMKTFVQKENAVQETLKQEYCFYERRYFAALDSFLQSVASKSLAGQQETIVQGRLAIARTLNQKLTLLTQITNGISKQRYASTSALQSDINSINGSLAKRRNELLEQREILQRESAAADLHKRMAEYTTEKNRANQNLLTLYGVLNITALAMIFYIART
jgi:hypothetical protein